MKMFGAVFLILATVAPVLSLVQLPTIGLAQPAKIFPFEYKLITLMNGFKAYLIETNTPGQISYVTVARVGSRDEWEPGKTGFAHFFEHVMFRGTEKYPDYDAMVSRTGAAYNAGTGTDRTSYYLVAATGSLEQIIDLESDRIMNLKYSEADFRTEAGAVLGEFNQGRANPYQHLTEKLMDTAFDRHTYKHLTIGFEKDVRSMPEGYQYSLSFRERYYRPENCVLLLAGDFDAVTAERLIAKYYSGWKMGYVPPDITPEPPQKAPRETTVEFPGRTLPILSVAYKGPAWSGTGKLAVATEVLGLVAFGPSSEIYRKLVITDQRVQTLQSDFELTRDPGLLTITTMVNKPGDVQVVKDEIQNVVVSFRTRPVDAKLLADTKSAMKYGFLMGLETPQGTNFALREFVSATGGIGAVEDYYRTLATITPDDVRMAANSFLVENGRTTVTLVPTAEVSR
jgi:zinc protease